MSTWIIVFLAFTGALFLAKLLFIIGVTAALPVTQGALFVSTHYSHITSFLNRVPMSRGQVFVDLGCGDGRVLRAARANYSVTALGFEVNPLAYLEARLLSLGRSGIRIKWKDFWDADLSEADIVFCYLFPDVMGRLANKLEQELKNGARVISYNFPLPEWKPYSIVDPEASWHTNPIYIYRFPDARSGDKHKSKRSGESMNMKSAQLSHSGA